MQRDPTGDLTDAEIADALMQLDAPKHQPNNYCPDCEIPMCISGAEFRCPQCLRTESAEITATDNTNSTKRNFSSADRSRSQKQATIRTLNDFASQHKGDGIPKDVLDEVANIYHEIQLKATEETTIDGVTTRRKFVRRGDNKNQILAYLIYAVCIRKNIVRSQKSIAMFMQLNTTGFSAGEQAVRQYEALGYIQGVCIGDEPIEAFIKRYFEVLAINNPNYELFVRDLVQFSIDKKICMQSKPISKIVGAIWVLIKHTAMNIDVAKLEAATDNTKKTTFIKFYDVVTTNIRVFAPIFKRYGVPAN